MKWRPFKTPAGVMVWGAFTLLLCLLPLVAAAEGHGDMVLTVSPPSLSLGPLLPLDEFGEVHQQYVREFRSALTIHVDSARDWRLAGRGQFEGDPGAGPANLRLAPERLAWRVGDGEYTPFTGNYEFLLDGSSVAPGADLTMDLRVAVTSHDLPQNAAFRLSFKLLPATPDSEPVSGQVCKEVPVTFELPAWLKLVVDTAFGDGSIRLAGLANPDRESGVDNGPGAAAQARIWANTEWELYLSGTGDFHPDSSNARPSFPLNYLEWTVVGQGDGVWSSSASGWNSVALEENPVAAGGATFATDAGCAVIDLEYRLRQDWLIRPGTYRTQLRYVLAAQ